jgi:subtilisin family serine protease
MGQYFVVNLADTVDPADALKLLSPHDDFSLVDYNYISHSNSASLTPNDPLYAPYQWHYRKIDLPDAWDITTGNDGVMVGTVDSGIDRLHPDLFGHIAVNSAEASGFVGFDDDGNGYIDDYYGWDFITNDGDPEDIFTNGHGTHVAGTIGATTNNGIGVAGVNWNVSLLACRVFDAFGGGATDLRIANAIYFLVDNGCWAINMSLGGPVYQPLEDVALDYAYSWNVPVIVSMGNDNAASTNFPAIHPHVLAVGATDSLDRRWVWNASSGSDYGNHIGVVAPGNVIASTMPFLIEYDTLTGTSMAAPHVTGLAALILSVRPTLSVDSLYWYIALGAEDQVGDPAEDIAGPDMYYGYGRINAYNSIRLALGQCVCECAYDPYCDGIRSDVLDVVQTVNVAFRGFSAVTDPGCPKQRSDVDASGATDVLDVVRVVNVAFRGFTVASQYVNPCQ